MPASPIPITAIEMMALANGTKAADHVRERLRANKSVGKRKAATKKSKKAGPIPLSSTEVTALKKGILSKKVQQRIAKTSNNDHGKSRANRPTKTMPHIAPTKH